MKLENDSSNKHEKITKTNPISTESFETNAEPIKTGASKLRTSDLLLPKLPAL